MLKVVPNAPNYFVDVTTGDIYSSAWYGRRNKYRSERLTNIKVRPTKLSPCTNRYGILVIGVYRETKAVADLVCSTVHGPCPGPNFRVKYLDGDLTNCKPTNLQWTDRRFDPEQLEQLGYSANQARPAFGFPAYWCTMDGQIVSTMYRTPKVLAASSNGYYGYLRVSLNLNRRPHNIYVHRAIWEAFNGPVPPGYVIRHLNSVPSDCRLANLQAGTHAENESDKIQNGTVKLSPEKAQQIGELVDMGNSYSDVAKVFGCTASMVGLVAIGKCWRKSRAVVAPF